MGGSAWYFIIVNPVVSQDCQTIGSTFSDGGMIDKA